MSSKSVLRQLLISSFIVHFFVFFAFLNSFDANANEQSFENIYPLSKDTQSRMEVITAFDNPLKRNGYLNTFKKEESLGSGEYVYIVELQGEPLAQNQNFINLRSGKLRSAETKNAIREMQEKMTTDQNRFLESASSTVGTKKPIHRYAFALNGFALKMTQAEAQKMSQMSGVKKITRDQVRRLETDRGPTLVGAPNLWEGQIPGVVATQGEGIIVGIIDSGVNTDHPSFAEVAGDGYVHTNPLGNNVFLGDCASQFRELCNNKLIGIRSYATITSDYSDTDVFPPNLPRNGEDYDGHGSHVAATAAGNVLLNQQVIQPEQGPSGNPNFESDGIRTDFRFEQVSGVAPRANIIAYQACYPGEISDEDTYAGCLTSVINAAIDDAIQDGVDVINFSISGGGDPWTDSTESAFLNALSAGIFVAVSAGNSGPEPSTSSKSSPWYTAVAASEHGRENGFVKEINNFSGGIGSPPVLQGRSNTGSVRAPIVYAGDFENPNDPNNDPAQCLQPFPSGTFDGQIVVCDRGEIARVEKAQNVAAGGAGGYVLANVEGGTTFLADDVYVVPGIHIKFEEGSALKQWLETGSGHEATITAGEASQFIDQDRVDVISNFSSRGPNQNISTLTPMMSAPGVNIFAAFADQSFGKDGDVAPSAGDFSFLQGTSMSSPHVAGAAALLMSAKPTWTVDQVRSALSMTATSDMRLDDEVTPADFFDVGAGRINVDQAVLVGLLMNVTPEEYTAANPSIGGDPRSLNLPSITDDNCRGFCTWSRTFRATQDGNWQVAAENISEGLSIDVSPSSFSLNEGESQTVEVTINSTGASKTDYAFARLRLTSNSSPDLVLPISVQGNIGEVPSRASISMQRSTDEFTINNLRTIAIDSLITTVFDVVDPIFINESLQEDSDAGSVIDNLSDGVSVTEFTVPEDSKRLIAKITESSANDMDLYLFLDANEDGFLSSSEQVASSISSGVIEEIEINFPDAGNYTLIVQNFSGSNGSSDTFEMHYAVVSSQTDNNVTATAPSSVLDDVSYDIELLYDFSEISENTIKYGAVGLSERATDLDFLGIINLDFSSGSLDTAVTGTPLRVTPNDIASLQVEVRPNNTLIERRYEIRVPTPTGTVFSSFDTQNSGRLENGVLIWDVTKPAGDSSTTSLDFEIQIVDDLPPGPVDIAVSSELLDRSFTSVFNPPPFQGIQVEGAPVVEVDTNNGQPFEVRETQDITIPVSSSDPNNDAVSLQFNQLSGPTAAISSNNNSVTITAPTVSSDQTLTFEVVATDASNNQATESFSVNVINNNAPEIVSVTAPESGNTGTTITISFTATDADNDNLTFSINGQPGSSRTLTLPNSGTSASYNISVTDGIDTVTQSVRVTLIAPPPPPPSSGGGGTMQWYFALFCLWCVLIRRYKQSS